MRSSSALICVQQNNRRRNKEGISMRNNFFLKHFIKKKKHSFRRWIINRLSTHFLHFCSHLSLVAFIHSLPKVILNVELSIQLQNLREHHIKWPHKFMLIFLKCFCLNTIIVTSAPFGWALEELHLYYCNSLHIEEVIQHEISYLVSCEGN